MGVKLNGNEENLIFSFKKSPVVLAHGSNNV
jgi:hypothetical protein